MKMNTENLDFNIKLLYFIIKFGIYCFKSKCVYTGYMKTLKF